MPRDLYSLFLSRGYKSELIEKNLRIVNKIDRSSLLKYKVKEPDKDKFKLRFFMNFDLNYITLKNNVLNDFNLMKNKFKWLIDFKLQFSNSISSNLKSILIDNFNSNLNESSYTRKCNKLNCKTCNFIFRPSNIQLSNNFSLPLKSNSNCDSKGVVYIIICGHCNIFYIGETGKRAKERIIQHLRDIRKFIPFHSKSSEVADHFNIKGHNLSRDFKFCIFNKDIKDKTTRVDIETNIRHIIENFRPVINVKKPSYLYINTLCFA